MTSKDKFLLEKVILRNSLIAKYGTQDSLLSLQDARGCKGNDSSKSSK